MAMVFKVKPWYAKSGGKYKGIWVPKTWSYKPYYPTWTFDADNIWTDGTNTYFSNSFNAQLVLSDRDTGSWTNKYWSNLEYPYGKNIWTDGNTMYYSYYNSSMSVEDGYYLQNGSWFATDLSLPFGDYRGSNVWTDGTNIYASNIYVNSSTGYQESSSGVFNKSNKTWSYKIWNGHSDIRGEHVWTDGDNIYYSYGSSQYILNISSSKWNNKTWTGLTNFYGSYIWSDGIDIYYSNGSTQKVLDKTNSTWVDKTWSGLTSFNGQYIWKDGDHIYYSNGTDQYELT